MLEHQKQSNMQQQQQQQQQQPKEPELNAICELQQSFQQFIMSISEQARNLQRNAMPAYRSEYNHQKFLQLQKQRQAVEMIKPPKTEQEQEKDILDAAERVSDSYVKLLNKINNLPDLKETEQALKQELFYKQAQNRESIKCNNLAKQKACFLYSNLEAAKQQILKPQLIEYHQEGIDYHQNFFRRNSSSGQQQQQQQHHLKIYNSEQYQKEDSIDL